MVGPDFAVFVPRVLETEFVTVLAITFAVFVTEFAIVFAAFTIVFAAFVIVLVTEFAAFTTVLVAWANTLFLPFVLKIDTAGAGERTEFISTVGCLNLEAYSAVQSNTFKIVLSHAYDLGLSYSKHWTVP
jgi:hypothetical protein